ncbi:MAG: tRNA (cytosine(32)/uridine(32)-2'-O)-methyltransferase TrmJ, partial [Acidiferrobacteraceae bacterium]|nr:tRNA (cytosine(32)/uridine(32)-2'-O)-methyltransferase TrmJ [Acidiferrobacteraceae bacterium]
DAGFIIGATARHRRISWPCADPETAMQTALRHSVTTKTAILFGREASGLTNKELDRCHLHVRIPVDDQYPSLNLASAVLIFCYELRRLCVDSDASSESSINSETVLASAAQVNAFFEHLETVLNEIQFLKYPSSRLLRKIKRIFSKRPLDEQEIHILRGILSSVQYVCRSRGAENGEKYRS